MKRLVAILMACMALVACNNSFVVPTQAHHAKMAEIGCGNLGMELKDVKVEQRTRGAYLVSITCGNGDVRISVDVPIIPPKQLKGV